MLVRIAIWLLRNLASLLMAPLVLAFVSEAASLAVQNRGLYLANWVTVGFVGYAVAHLVIYRRMDFIRILEHELGHMIVAFALLRPVRRLHAQADFDAERDGGYVTVASARNFLITLAPYYLPVFTLPLLTLKLFLHDPLISDVINLLIGVTLAFHFMGLLTEFRFYQDDIMITGVLFSLCMVGLFNALIFVAVLCIVTGRYSDYSIYLANAFARTREWYGYLYRMAASSIET